MKEVLDLALQNNPDILNQQINVLNAQSNAAQARASKGLNASISASLGYSQQALDVNAAYNHLSNSQLVACNSLCQYLTGVWAKAGTRWQNRASSCTGSGKPGTGGLSAESFLDVEQFNLQKYQVEIAAKSDTVAMKRYEVTKQRFLIGKIAVLDLNDADSRKDQNKRAYVQAFAGLLELFLQYQEPHPLRLYQKKTS